MPTSSVGKLWLWSWLSCGQCVVSETVFDIVERIFSLETRAKAREEFILRVEMNKKTNYNEKPNRLLDQLTRESNKSSYNDANQSFEQRCMKILEKMMKLKIVPNTICQ